MNMDADADLAKEATLLFEESKSIEALFEVVILNDKRKWPALREIHKQISSYKAYAVDWTRVFTPIERAAWSEIRYYSLPMLPQFPIGRVFVDFADPGKKICIECDGEEFHDAAKDKARDEILNSQGWCVFRISGADCWREPEIIEDPDEDRSEEWLGSPMAGLALCLRTAFYSNGAEVTPGMSRVLIKRCGGYRWGTHQ